MIHFISRYFYEARRDKVHMMTRHERRAMFLTCGILCITITILLWLLH